MNNDFLMQATVKKNEDSQLATDLHMDCPATDGMTATGAIVAASTYAIFKNARTEKDTPFSDGVGAAIIFATIQRESFAFILHCLLEGKTAEEQKEIIRGFSLALIEKGRELNQMIADAANQPVTWN